MWTSRFYESFCESQKSIKIDALYMKNYQLFILLLYFLSWIMTLVCRNWSILCCFCLIYMVSPNTNLIRIFPAWHTFYENNTLVWKECFSILNLVFKVKWMPNVEPKWVNPIWNKIGVNSLRLGDLQM